MIRRLRLLANWIADHSIEDHGYGYCAVDEDGYPCGRPAMATGTNDAGDTVPVCSMHDWAVTP